MSGEAFADAEVRTGPEYEAARTASRTQLAAAAGNRRVALGDDLVLVFETRATVRAALEEVLRSERIGAPGEVASEAAAFSALLAGPGQLASTLYVDVADPVALSERIGGLAGIADSIFLEVAGERVPGAADATEASTGAFRLTFALDQDQGRALAAGATVRVVSDHPRCRAEVTLGPEQVRAIAADLLA